MTILNPLRRCPQCAQQTIKILCPICRHETDIDPHEDTGSHPLSKSYPVNTERLLREAEQTEYREYI